MKDTHLLSINGTPVSSIADAQCLFAALPTHPQGTCQLVLALSELCDGLTAEGIPHISLDQLNPRHFFHVPSHHSGYSNTALLHHIQHSWDGGVLHYLNRAHKLTWGILLKQDNWNKWQQSEFLQLDQYDLQHMFGTPVAMSNGSAVFNLVWAYAVKEVDGRKKT